MPNRKWFIVISYVQGNIAHEAQTGKIYRANYCDKYGRTVLIMRPGFQVALLQGLFYIYVYIIVIYVAVF